MRAFEGVRKVFILLEELGDALFAELLKPGNFYLVEEFCKELRKTAVPDKVIFSDRSYRVFSPLQAGESYLRVEFMNRAIEVGASGSAEHGEYWLEHQGEIPKNLKGKDIVFPEWYPEVFSQDPNVKKYGKGGVTFLDWHEDAQKWVKNECDRGCTMWEQDSFVVKQI